MTGHTPVSFILEPSPLLFGLCTLPKHSQVQYYIVSATLSNVALGKPGWQSSIWSWSGQEYAVDGNTGTHLNNDGCAHTTDTGGGEQNPTLAYDLLQLYHVSFVEVTNRGDCCCE